VEPWRCWPHSPAWLVAPWLSRITLSLRDPDITVELSEAAAYPSQARAGDSLVAVAAGEAISERHALDRRDRP
jgi:hypothetical protein